MQPRTPQNPDAQASLGTAIRRARGRQGHSQEALAGAAGITRNMLSLIERGQGNPSWSTVCGIAGALGMTVAELAKRVEAEDV